MAKKWYERFISFSTWKSTNLIEISGSLLIIISLVLPWFYGNFRFSRKSLAGAEIIFNALFNGATYPVIALLTVPYLLITAIIVPFTKKSSIRALIALTGIILSGFAIYTFPAQSENYGVGPVFTLIGLLMIPLSLITNRS